MARVVSPSTPEAPDSGTSGGTTVFRNSVTPELEGKFRVLQPDGIIRWHFRTSQKMAAAVQGSRVSRAEKLKSSPKKKKKVKMVAKAKREDEVKDSPDAEGKVAPAELPKAGAAFPGVESVGRVRLGEEPCCSEAPRCHV